MDLPEIEARVKTLEEAVTTLEAKRRANSERIARLEYMMADVHFALQTFFEEFKNTRPGSSV